MPPRVLEAKRQAKDGTARTQSSFSKWSVTTFDVALGSWLGQHNACIVSPTCGKALVLEHNGDVYSCDHYVEPNYLLGNVRHTPLKALVESESSVVSATRSTTPSRSIAASALCCSRATENALETGSSRAPRANPV